MVLGHRDIGEQGLLCSSLRSGRPIDHRAHPWLGANLELNIDRHVTLDYWATMEPQGGSPMVAEASHRRPNTIWAVVYSLVVNMSPPSATAWLMAVTRFTDEIAQQTAVCSLVVIMSLSVATARLMAVTLLAEKNMRM